MNYILLGKPNVGKSSIFNILTGSNINIIHSVSGTTRDWHKELIKNTSSFIYDTPGILEKKNDYLKFFTESNNYLFMQKLLTFLYVVDFKSGFNNFDKDSINLLRKHNKKIILIINKFDNFDNSIPNDFYKFGIETIFSTSCSHRLGFADLKKKLDIANDNTLKKFETHTLAIFGKPNAGKSTFLNTILGYKRSLTSPIAGTTSDFVSDQFVYKKKIFKIIDTAGIGRKANIIKKSINDLSIKKTLENIYNINSAILLIDASEGLDRQDKRIIKLISENSKNIIIIFNKIDLIFDEKNYQIQTLKEIDHTLPEVKNIKIFFISALIKKNVHKILEYTYNSLLNNNYKISTSELNKWLKNVTNKSTHPLIDGKKINFKYAVQLKVSPVTVKIFCSYSNRINNTYKRYLIKNFNYYFKILNQKTRLLFSSSKNPYI